MNKVIGTVETKQVSVLQGDHHIITAVKIADGQAAFKAGCVLYEDSGAYKALGASDSEHKAVAVALEDLGATAKDAVVNVCVHGLCRTEDLCYADGTAVKARTVSGLRSAGIYCTGTPAAED